MVNAYEYHFFFIDIVGLSEPSLSTEEQIKKINVLNQCIRECDAFKSIPQNKLKILPTGDGAVIGFTERVNLPLDLAIQLHRKLRTYNDGKSHKESIRVRIGIHTAPVMNVKDLRNEENIWGDGIIIARRIMDAGQADHILLSSQVAEKLAKLSDDYKKILYHAGLATFKHGRQEFLWYSYGDGFGNNSTSGIEGLNVQEKDATFSAEILEKKVFHLGETIFTKVHFKGKLHGGFFDNMFSAPPGKTFPDGGSNWWCVDHNSYSGKNAPAGDLVGEVDAEYTWGCTLSKNLPTGEYAVYIRVYDHLSSGQRPVIREKVETILVVDEHGNHTQYPEPNETSIVNVPERGIELPADGMVLRWILRKGRELIQKNGSLNVSLNKQINILRIIAAGFCIPFLSVSFWYVGTRTFDSSSIPMMFGLGFLMLGMIPFIYLANLIKNRKCSSCDSNFTLEKIKSTLLEEKQIGSRIRRIEENTYRCTFCNEVSTKKERRYDNAQN